MKIVPIVSTDKVALVDDEDYDLVMKSKWFLRSGYATTWMNPVNLALHRLLLEVPELLEVDHIDRDKLNNQKGNLRIVNSAQNAQNRWSSNNTSTYKCVTYDQTTGKFKARLGWQNKRLHLGSFVKPEQAAKAYDTKAIELFGPLALTNKRLGLL